MKKQFLLIAVIFVFVAASVVVYFIFNSKDRKDRIDLGGGNWIETKSVDIDGEVVSNSYSPEFFDSPLFLTVNASEGTIRATYGSSLTQSPCFGEFADLAGIRLTDYPVSEIERGELVEIAAKKATLYFEENTYQDICVENVKVVK